VCKLLKGSVDTDIHASQLRLRDRPFEIIKEKVFAILVDLTTYMMIRPTESPPPLDEDVIRQICGMAIGFGALDEARRTEEQQGMIIAGAVLLEQGQARILDDTSQESMGDDDAFTNENQDTQKQSVEETIEILNKELESEMAEKYKGEMRFSWALSFDRRTDGKRPCHVTGELEIKIVTRKQFNTTERNTIIALMGVYGHVLDPQGKAHDC
jgi:hypothetical protein